VDKYDEKMKLFKNPLPWLVMSLTIGLAPFTPEPHIWGKLKWVVGGANGMQTMDWFDFVMHGAPWLMLLLSLLFFVQDKVAQSRG
jgi:hypothetical protein